jgi:hypothetical protein
MTTSSEPTDVALERRVATFLRAEAPAVAPPGLLDGALRQLDATPARPARPRLAGVLRSPEWLGLGLMAAFVVAAVVGVVALGGGSAGQAGAGPGAGSAPDYDGIRFQANGLVIDAGGQRFTLDPATATVHSDPGNATFRTLEWTWTQHGVGMRLNLYFASDGDRWWVSEVRTYDGRQPGEWLTATGRFFERPVGSAFDGPVDMTLPVAKAGTGVGRLRVDRLLLLPTFQPPIVSATTGPVADPGDGGPILTKVDAPFAAGQLLNCIGAERMTAQQLALYVRGKGYPVEYRYEKDSYASDQEPPAGSVLTGAIWGSEGQLLISAVAPDDPMVDQMRLTAERACPKDGGEK